MSQKRRVPRRAIHARIGLLVRGRYSICVTHEIGEGGILISSHEPLETGDLVVLTFRLPNILNGVVMGRVTYGIEGGNKKYGIQFEKIDFEIKRKIRNYVASSNVALPSKSTGS